MSLRVLIVDDEPLACERLQALLQELPQVSVAGTAHDGPRALALAAELKPDLLLLDVRMPGMDGLEVVRHLALLDEPPAVVFATAYDEYAMEAFEAQAIGYLLKPVRKERLAAAIERARRLTRRQIDGMQAAAAGPGHANAPRSQIAVRLRDRLKLIRVQDIFYFAADRKYTTVCHTQGKDLIEDSLRALEEEFTPQFVRIHRNTVVNGTLVTAVERPADGQYCVVLRGLAEQLPVSRRLMGELRDRFDL